MKTDFYTQIHKALRHCLFTFSIQIGSSDYTLPSVGQHNHNDLMRVLDLLKLHAVHEEKFLHPLIKKKLNQVDELNHEHQMQESELVALEQASLEIICSSDKQERIYKGLLFYRKLNCFIANYLRHLEDEESLTPIIQQSFSDQELIHALETLLKSFTQEEILDSITYMLPALNVQEQLNMMQKILAKAEEQTRDRMLKQAKNALSPLKWRQLNTNLG
ncbi:hemerythrin domain-containing protein [Legionella fallonii]|uniref:Hemerythrin-like domain-containing protein n=1 Tax=Legionella fallonii LLAP-10 TaxID=1212491 RepID=A0A098G5S9_9GAMM|nr:hypothetical protein [Legionella fallonii]CEG57329.1 protein of unknown function [Legionella fallonii LLAP-10]